MSLFDRKIAGKPVEPLTAKRAQELYVMFRSGKNHTQMFIEDSVSFSESKQVWDEIKRLETEILSKMSGTYVIKSGIPEERDAEGKVIKPAVLPVYYKPTTEKALAESLKSELLDTLVITQDARKFSDGNPDDFPTWKDWLASFTDEMLLDGPVPKEIPKGL